MTKNRLNYNKIKVREKFKKLNDKDNSYGIMNSIEHGDMFNNSLFSLVTF